MRRRIHAIEKGHPAKRFATPLRNALFRYSIQLQFTGTVYKLLCISGNTVSTIRKAPQIMFRDAFVF